MVFVEQPLASPGSAHNFTMLEIENVCGERKYFCKTVLGNVNTSVRGTNTLASTSYCYGTTLKTNFLKKINVEIL